MRAWGGLLAVLLAVALARTAPAWNHVFVGERGIRLLGADAYYHLRHARHVRTDGAVRRWDPWTHYPVGQRATTPGLFDVAAAALPLSALPFLPPALGVAGVAALFVLLRRVAGTGAALLGAACLALYPGQLLARSLLGFLDHHAAEVLLALLAVLGFVRCLDRAEADDPLPWWRPAGLEALPMAAFLFTWSGAPVHLLLLAGSIAVLGFARLVASGDPGRLPEACARYGIALFALVALSGWLAPWLVMRPGLHPFVLAACASFALVAAPLLLAARRARRPRLAAVLLAGAGAGAALVAARFDLVRQLLARRTALVAEHLPVDAARVFDLHGGVLPLAAAGLVVACAAVRADRGRRLFVAAYALGLAALWRSTRDFGYVAAPFLAALAGFAWFGRPRPRRAVLAAAGLAVVLVAPIWPISWSSRPWPTRRWVDGAVVCSAPWAVAMSWLRERTPEPTLPFDGAPEPFGNFAYPAGTYGVWSAWDFGNLVSALGRRPVAWSQGAGRHPAEWLLDRDEEAAIARLQRGCRGPERIRYVVLDAETMGDHYVTHLTAAGYDVAALARSMSGKPPGEATFGPRLDETVAARLYFRDGDGLGRFRLVYLSPYRTFLGYVAETRGAGGLVRRRAVPAHDLEARKKLAALARRGGVTELPGLGFVYGGTIERAVKVFECVKGARVRGRTDPGVRVAAVLTLVDAAGGRRAWQRRVHSDAEGRFELRVPYATAGGPTDVRAGGRLVLEARRTSGGRARRLVTVPEPAVLSGAVVEAGELVPVGAGRDGG